MYAKRKVVTDTEEIDTNREKSYKGVQRRKKGWDNHHQI
jgi:hypothetical protein